MGSVRTFEGSEDQAVEVVVLETQKQMHKLGMPTQSAHVPDRSQTGQQSILSASSAVSECPRQATARPCSVLLASDRSQVCCSSCKGS